GHTCDYRTAKNGGVAELPKEQVALAGDWANKLPGGCPAEAVSEAKARIVIVVRGAHSVLRGRDSRQAVGRSRTQCPGRSEQQERRFWSPICVPYRCCLGQNDVTG